MRLGVISQSIRKPSMGMVVTTKEGKKYNLGRIRTGFILGPLSRLIVNIKIANYRRDRLKNLEGDDRVQFESQVLQLKQNMRSTTQ